MSKFLLVDWKLCPLLFAHYQSRQGDQLLLYMVIESSSSNLLDRWFWKSRPVFFNCRDLWIVTLAGEILLVPEDIDAEIGE